MTYVLQIAWGVVVAYLQSDTADFLMFLIQAV